MPELSKLEEIKDLRTQWPDEARDFTPWLSKHISFLADAVGFDITIVETESHVGDFKADILAYETETNRKIIIENQLEATNHDHLGKLITYASGKSANIIIWVVKQAREEHRSAIEWLNNHTDEDVGFFLCEIKLFCIGTSARAPRFEVIEQPNNWTKGMNTITVNETGLQNYDYWTAFVDYASRNTAFTEKFNCRKPGIRHYMDFGIGSSAWYIGVLRFRFKNVLAVRTYIYNDKASFHELFEKKDDIESETGLTFDWLDTPEKSLSSVVIEKEVNFGDKQQWNAQFDWIIDVMLKMKTTFKKYL